jgi:hypothetical protein
VSNKKRPHDVVEPNTCLKMWDKGSKGEDGMIVHQELGLDGRAENGGNPGRAIPWNHVPFEKSGGPFESLQVKRIGLWILRVNIKPLIRHRELGGGIVDAVFSDFW